MDVHNKDELEKYLEEYFIENQQAFKAGSTNDDMVDFCCICFALGYTPAGTCRKLEDWFVKFNIKDSERNRIHDHYDRIENWLIDKENYGGYVRGETDIMGYAINY